MNMAQLPEIDYDRREAHFLFRRVLCSRAKAQSLEEDIAGSSDRVGRDVHPCRSSRNGTRGLLKRQEHELIIRVHDADAGAVADIKIDGQWRHLRGYRGRPKRPQEAPD